MYHLLNTGGAGIETLFENPGEVIATVHQLETAWGLSADLRGEYQIPVQEMRTGSLFSVSLYAQDNRRSVGFIGRSAQKQVCKFRASLGIM
ncbi:hypothetical protein CGA24_21230 [Salmonella enterica subsp. enterica]|nr:hypothetical protein CGA24_21230 [Salmonella enterica subsp. enterica]